MPHTAWPEVGLGSSRRYLQLCGLAGEIPVGNFSTRIQEFSCLSQRQKSVVFAERHWPKEIFARDAPPAVPVMPPRACDACKARKVKVRTQSTEHSLDPAQGYNII
jgi:hypothetical protein